MPVGDVAKLIIRLTAQGSIYTPSLHFRQAVSQPGLSSLIGSWRGDVETAMRTCMSPQLSVIGYSAEDLVPGTAATEHEVLTPPLPGTAVGTGLPGQDAVLFSLKTGLKTARARGRVYWPGATEEQHDAGHLSTAGVAPWETFRGYILANYLGETPASGWTLVTYSPEQLDPPKPPPTFKPRPGRIVTTVNDVLVDTVIRSQRRRQVGVGQ
jgi:hypothetical protein